MRYARFKIRNIKDGPRTTGCGAPAKAGLTLLEMVIVVAVIVILASMVIGIATNVDNQSRKQLTAGTISILNSALQQFHDFGYQYHYNLTSDAWSDFCFSLKFPLDCNGFITVEIMSSFSMLGREVLEISDSQNSPSFAGSEILYLCLSQVPQCRETLDRIDKSLLTNKGRDGSPLFFRSLPAPPGKDEHYYSYPLYRIIDAWGTTLRYDYYDERAVDFIKMKETIRTFPLITSAGPDKDFSTPSDNITNR